MNKLKTIFPTKKLAIFLMAAFSLFILVACGSSSGVPYGSLGDDTYLSVGNNTVTEKTLYDQLRTSAVARLNTYIDEVVFADVALDTANLSEFEVKAFEQEINTALFSSAITPTQLSTYPDYLIAQRILSYADSFLITNPDVNKTDLEKLLDAVAADVVARASAPDFDEEATFIFGYLDKALYSQYASVIDALIKQYKLPVLKKVHAKNLLGSVVGEGEDGDINDEDSSVYIEESHAVTYYKNNIAGRYDVSALIVSFDSVKEHEIARYKYAIKSNARGEWYALPNIADQAVIDILNTGSTHPSWSSAGYHQKAVDILVNDLNQVQGSFVTVDYRTTDFATYYSKYVINSTVDAELLLDDARDNNQVLEVFLNIYDDLNNTAYAGLTNEQLTDIFTLEYNAPIFKNSTELRTQIYNMDSDVLYDGGSGQDEEGVAYSKPYSRQVQTIGGKPYLIFLFDDNRSEDDDVLDETDEENVVFADNENAQALKLEAYEKLIEQRLTSAYITTKTTEKYEDVSVNIYDPIIREVYKNSYEYEGSTGFKNNDVLAEVIIDGTTTTLNVDDYFALIEKTLGLSTALDIILVKKLRSAYGDEITKEDMADFREQFESQYVNPFLSNQYESAGFPASMGIENFLLVGFGAWAHDGRSATEDAIDKVYVQTELRTKFEADLTAHFGIENTASDNIYSRLATLSNNLRDQQTSIGATHLLFQIDIDRDGEVDDPTELDPAVQAEYDQLIEELIIEVNKRAKLATSITTGLQNVVTAYNNATRYELSTVTLPENPTPQEIEDYINGYDREDVWVKFRRAGITLLYQDLGTISNETNFPNSSSSLDVDFYEYAMALAQHIKDEVTAEIDGEAPTSEEMTDRANALLPLYAPAAITTDHTVVSDGNSAVRTAFGWHLVVATSYTHQLSAKVQAISDSEKETYTSAIDNPFVEGEKLVGYNNDNDNITWQQILISIEESKEETGVITLPSSLQTTLTKYFGTIYPTSSQDKYKSSYAQLEIAFLYIFDGNVSLTDTTLNARLQTLRAANFNQFFNYAYFDGVDGSGTSLEDRAYNAYYAAAYGDFFTVLGA